MEKGVVTFFNEEELFGFMMCSLTLERVFLHMSACHWIVPGDEGPIFGKKHHESDGIALPRIDDVIYFDRAKSDKGVFAKSWGIDEEYRLVQEGTWYRVVREESGKSTIDFIGTQDELRSTYPKGVASGSDVRVSVEMKRPGRNWEEFCSSTRTTAKIKELATVGANRKN